MKSTKCSRSADLLWFACALAGGAIAQAQTTEVVLHNFETPPTGANPYAGVIRDAAGDLYGTTQHGGAANMGVIFKLDATGQETLLYTFTRGVDGGGPLAGVIHSGGNLYGTTYYGGALSAGVVFKLNITTGHETVLHSFRGGADGGNPRAAVVLDSAGNLVGGPDDHGTDDTF